MREVKLKIKTIREIEEEKEITIKVANRVKDENIVDALNFDDSSADIKRQIVCDKILNELDPIDSDSLTERTLSIEEIVVIK